MEPVPGTSKDSESPSIDICSIGEQLPGTSHESPLQSKPMTRAERNRFYRQRSKDGKRKNEQSDSARPLTSTERSRMFRQRERERRKDVPNPSSSTQRGTTRENRNTPVVRGDEYRRRWNLANQRFQVVFTANEYGHVCSVCDRLWFLTDLKKVSPAVARRLRDHFPDENVDEFVLCRNCLSFCSRGRFPAMSRTNGFRYPPYPHNLPTLNPVEERLVSPRLPYMQVRRLRHAGQYGIVGQVINIPVDVNNMVQTLPRQLDDDYAINVNIKRSLIHKSSYLSGFVRKGVIKAWLRYLVEKPLYRQHKIQIDWDRLEQNFQNQEARASTSTADEAADNEIETLDCAQVPESELCYAQQHTMLWNESKCLDIAPGQRETPLNIIFDRNAEELSFPMIYLGEARQIKEGVKNTPYSMCTSEIRRRDRRGAKPPHILYMAMCMLRRRVTDGVYNTFRINRALENITRQQIENREFVEQLVDVDTAFLKSIPNSVQYWASRKRDLFAMIRQLGKPTGFMTLSASEARWPHLLKILHKWNPEWHKDYGADISEEDIMGRMNAYKRHHLVAEDPVTCCIYFYKMVLAILNILSSQRGYNPFGKYRIIDYFLRIEFQNRGSPHAHILVWLANDPREDLSENMPLTVQMITDLCSVDKHDLPDENLVSNQTHDHTFTCFKRGEQTCRFGIPYWPMRETRILVPLAKDDNRRKLYQKKVLDAKKKLSEKTYESIESYLTDIGASSYADYLDMIRSTLRRPVVCFKREMDQVMINTFNPWIAGVLKSNMDLQLVLDPYSCAAYVVEYVNKSNRGISHFHRQLIELHERDPQADYATLMKSLALKMLNSAEMSAQEAAWYLLRQPMSWASRNVVTIPTMMPVERHRSRKRKSVMDSEGIGQDSTDIWTKNIIEKYEGRPATIENVTLAQFAAWYDLKRKSDEGDDDDELGGNNDDHDEYDVNDDDRTEPINEPDANEDAGNHRRRRQRGGSVDRERRRKICRVIRYTGYDVANNIEQYKREQVLLHLPFRNEHADIMDRNRFIQTYDEREREIIDARKEFEFNIDINAIIAMVAELCAADEQNANVDPVDNPPGGVHFEKTNDGNDDDVHILNPGISAVRDRGTMMTKQQYCESMRNTNQEQRELILEAIYRLHSPETTAIQIFFTGPAGSGKTFTMKLLMETYNRYTVKIDGRPPQRNAYIACASTGKAAAAINGVTVHSAFRLTLSRQTHDLSANILQPYRHIMRDVRAVVLDEVSMCSAQLLSNVNERLQQITGVHDEPFGGINFIATGDLYQLPPVNASSVYKPLRGVLGGALLWQSLQYFPLTRVMRQSDERFSSILTKIGAGKSLDNDERQLIESRFRSKEWCNDNLEGVVRLFFNNSDVEEFNRRAIPRIANTTVDEIAEDVYTGYTTEDERRDARAKVHRMKLAETGNLPFVVTFTPGYSYMMTINADVEDGLVNGVIGELRYIEEIPVQHPGGEQNDGQIIRYMWFQFETPAIGQRTRIKWRPHVRTRQNVISEDWVPIIKRSCSFNITRKIRCKRTQFPIVPSCAMTIHKSQGGTFKKIVYDYNKKHAQPLVYVAMSRVISVDGFFMTNATNDWTFYHARGSTAPGVKETRDEYARLSNHRLETVTQDISRFLDDTKKNQRTCVMTNINVQSLQAHSCDLSTDSLINRSDLLNLTETWMVQDREFVPIQGFEMVNRYDCPKQRAGGVAVYQKCDTLYRTIPRELKLTADHRVLLEASGHVGDIVAVEVCLPGQERLVLCTVYIHHGQSFSNVAIFFTGWLFEYSNVMEFINMQHKGKMHVPLIVAGDFNLSIEDRNRLCEFFQQHYNLQLINDVSKPTTLSNTCLDLTFARGIDAACKPYVSYFSHHYPVFNVISTNNKEKEKQIPDKPLEIIPENEIAGPSHMEIPRSSRRLNDSPDAGKRVKRLKK